MSFEDLGRTLDELAENLAQSAGTAMRGLSRTIQLSIAPHPTAEGRRLTEDLLHEGYDLVERNSVRVERVPAECHAGDAANVEYYDGTDWCEVTRYDLVGIERHLEVR